MKNTVGFVCFGEVNTPFHRLQEKHDRAVQSLKSLDIDLIDAGIVIDDPQYETADMAQDILKRKEMSALIVCVAGWVPTHAVIYTIDPFRAMPVLLWGLCGAVEQGKIVTTAEQAGTTAIRPVLEAMDYRFKFIYNVIGKPEPLDEIQAFLRAAFAVQRLRRARIGSMGYRDMLLYGTQYEGLSLRGQIGPEVEPFEMLEMLQRMKHITQDQISAAIQNFCGDWHIQKACDKAVLEKGVHYALALAEKIKERGWDAITLIDVDGMKKLLGYPPAIVFMLLERLCSVCTIPENDVMGNVTQLMARYVTGQTAHYMEYYEFFERSLLIGVPDYVPVTAVKDQVELLPTAFGLLDEALLNVSKVKTGYVTCVRLYYKKGRYYLHMYTGEACPPPAWEEFGWAPPAPQLPSLEVFPDSCTVEEFAQKVSGQHVIVCYGNFRKEFRELCRMLDITMVE
ncbi:MAG: hypothetical protein II888_04050 [Clostridia bacterium]|nr:hypothetical protein [Clostridia bacterium]